MNLKGLGDFTKALESMGMDKKAAELGEKFQAHQADLEGKSGADAIQSITNMMGTVGEAGNATMQGIGALADAMGLKAFGDMARYAGEKTERDGKTVEAKGRACGNG